MRKLILTSAFVLLTTAIFSAKTNNNTTTQNTNLQYHISYSKATCTLFLWHTDALGNETHWTETYDTSTQADCNKMLVKRLQELEQVNPCGSGKCPG